MDKPQHSDPLQEKRRQTDVNLSTEREKTDEALKGISESIETSFDETIAEARARDDCATKRERKIADREIAHQRSETPSTSVGTETRKDVATKGSENINENVDENISERVKLERQRSDAAIERERSRVHVALERERDAKTAAMNTMLEAERGQTDESLDAERVRTDQDMSRSHSLLMHEALEHGKTKTLLMTRDEFLAIVSHDLRNPLSAIASSVEMLLEEATKKGWDSEGRRWLELIHRNANAAIRLIQDLIDVERMAEGKLEFRFSRHLVRDILLEAVESFRSVAQANGVRLQADHELLSGYVVCDRGRITQVLSNLLGNAIKFTPRGGTVTLRSELTADRLNVSVADTGPGIRPEQRERIFERYYQANEDGREGLGLGLYISRMLIEAHDGRIWVASEPGRGSTFHFSIPRW